METSNPLIFIRYYEKWKAYYKLKTDFRKQVKYKVKQNERSIEKNCLNIEEKKV